MSEQLTSNSRLSVLRKRFDDPSKQFGRAHAEALFNIISDLTERLEISQEACAKVVKERNELRDAAYSAELKRLADEPKATDEGVADARRWIAYLESEPQHEPDISIARVLRDLVQFYEWALPQITNRTADEPETALDDHSELLKKLPNVHPDLVAELEKLSKWALVRRVLIQADWLGSYSKCLDGLDLRVGVDGCWNPRDIRAAVEKLRAAEPPAGVKCTHCNGKGYNEPIYDEQDGWTDETPCETCNGSGRITTVEQYLKTLPANWHEDSSLETWFPITAEELKRLKDERASQPPSAPPYDRDKYPTARLAAEAFAEQYVDSYETIGEDAEGREGTYTPTDQEDTLIRDAIRGLMADEDFVDLIATMHAERQAQRAAEGRCLSCGCPAGDHYVKCRASVTTALPAPSVCGNPLPGKRGPCVMPDGHEGPCDDVIW